MRSETVAGREMRRSRDADDRGAPPGGARELTAILPNGRTLWLRVDAPLAPAASANYVALLAEDRFESESIFETVIDPLVNAVPPPAFSF